MSKRTHLTSWATPQRGLAIFSVAVFASGFSALSLADVDLATKFTNQGSIGNTRHNLTQRQVSGGGPAGVSMDSYRNDYEEVCVYCHTPHGANRTSLRRCGTAP